MWKLFVIVFFMNDAGQVAPMRGEHPQTFASAAECYAAAAELYQDTDERIQGLSILCSRQQEREA
jgi:hypothetical protein